MKKHAKTLKSHWPQLQVTILNYCNDRFLFCVFPGLVFASPALCWSRVLSALWWNRRNLEIQRLKKNGMRLGCGGAPWSGGEDLRYLSTRSNSRISWNTQLCEFMLPFWKVSTNLGTAVELHDSSWTLIAITNTSPMFANLGKRFCGSCWQF